jgi:hypothetical protein
MYRHFLTSLLLLGSISALAQNPIIRDQFSADPTARVFEGRIYLYPSHDISPVGIPGVRQDWFCMADYHCFSSDNLVDWVDHGVILDQKDVPWGDPTAYSMWAPDCVQGKDGRYYFYFPDAPQKAPGDNRGGFTVGVAIADHPYGPFEAHGTSIQGIRGIDPCVLQASNGKNYIYWAGGALFQAELSDNMLELASEVQRVEGLPAGFVEGPFAFEHNGKYYLTYPWVREENGTETLAYAMSDSPLGPWEFKGIIMEEWSNRCWTNHHSLVEFKGQWYLFYHHNDYSPSFDKNRSVCVDSLSFNADGTIRQVIPTNRGVGITDGSSKIQMDRGTLSGGATIAYNDSLQPFSGWKVILPPGASVEYSNVNLEKSSSKVWVNEVSPSGKSKIRPIKKTGLKLLVRSSSPTRSHFNLRLENPSSRPVQVDWISFNKGQR